MATGNRTMAGRQPLPTAPTSKYRSRSLMDAAGEQLRRLPLGARLRGWGKAAYHAAWMLQTGGRGLSCTLPSGEQIRVLPEHRYLSWNSAEYAAFRGMVAPGSVALDVGANVGAYSVLFGQWAGPSGRVYAFEPSPAALRGLVRHVALNSLEPVVKPVGAAVADRDGTGELIVAGTAGESRLAGAAERSETVTVPTVTIDSFCGRAGGPSRRARDDSPRRRIAGGVRRTAPVDLGAHRPRACRLRSGARSPGIESGTARGGGSLGSGRHGRQGAPLMRILVANDGLSDVGGVQSYLDCVLSGLAARGHAVAIVHCSDSGRPEVASVNRQFEAFTVGAGRTGVMAAIRAWAPDLCFSHNINDLSLEQTLLDSFPVVKFMHGYFGTCVGGQKMHAFPARVPCERPFGPACLALYLPRHCCRWDPATLVTYWRWTSAQHRLLASYRMIVVASRHMRAEFERNGVDANRIVVNPLFTTIPPAREVPPAPAQPTVIFLGRMTSLKGGDLLIAAIDIAQRRLGRPIHLVMAGDGPRREEWQSLAARSNVRTTFPGWLAGDARIEWLSRASVAALPSTWPEPFGLVGLEAAALGVPTIAFDVGGISEWLRHDVNGVAVPGRPSAEAFGGALSDLLGNAPRLAALRAGARRLAGEMPLGAHLERLDAVFDAVRGPLLAVS
jgi:FkbM family methyltransferase